MKNLAFVLSGFSLILGGCGAFKAKESNQRHLQPTKQATPSHGEVNAGNAIPGGTSGSSEVNLVGPPPLSPAMLKMAPASATDFNKGPYDCTVSDAILASYVSTVPNDGGVGSQPLSKHDLYCRDLWIATLSQFHIPYLNGAAPAKVGNNFGFGPVPVGQNDPVVVNIVIDYKIPQPLRKKFQFSLGFATEPDSSVAIPTDAETLTATLPIPLAKLQALKAAATLDAQGNFSVPFHVYAKQIVGTLPSAGPMATFPVVFSGVPEPSPGNSSFPVSISVDAQADGAFSICFSSQGRLIVVASDGNPYFALMGSYVVSQNGGQTSGAIKGANTFALPGDYKKACHPAISMVSWEAVAAGRTMPPIVNPQSPSADQACLAIDDSSDGRVGPVHLVLNATTNVCP